jgi:hypothetical protein
MLTDSLGQDKVWLIVVTGTASPPQDVFRNKLQEAARASESMTKLIDKMWNREWWLPRFINNNFGYRLHMQLSVVPALKARGDARALLSMVGYSDDCWAKAAAAASALADLGVAEAVLPTIQLLHNMRALQVLLGNSTKAPKPEDVASRVLVLISFTNRVRVAAALTRMRPLVADRSETAGIDEDLHVEREYFSAHYMTQGLPWDDEIAGVIRTVLGDSPPK